MEIPACREREAAGSKEVRSRRATWRTAWSSSRSASISFTPVPISFDAAAKEIASAGIEEIAAPKQETDASKMMSSGTKEEDAAVKDEPAGLSWKRVEVKGISPKTICIDAEVKEIDAEVSIMHAATKGFPSKPIGDLWGGKGMRHDRRDRNA